MKRFCLLIALSTLSLLLSDSLAIAQPPGGGMGRPGGFGGGGFERGGPGGGRPGDRGGSRGQSLPGRGAQQTPPLLRVFDTDGNGQLDESEIDSAATALRKLDRDRNGKLSAEELRPTNADGQQGRQSQQRGGPRGDMQGGRPGGGPPSAGRGDIGGRANSGRPGGGRPARGGNSAAGGGRPGGGGRGGDPAQADASFAAQVMAFDENKDGALSQSELPEHMHKAFSIADANRDSFLDQAERLVLASQFRRNMLNPSDDQPVNAPNQGRRN